MRSPIKGIHDLPVLLFEDIQTWETWLTGNYDSSAGLWLRIAKKSSRLQTISYQDALEIALCYGWIDGQKKTYDNDSWLQKFTPRGHKSIWSKINRSKAVELIEIGRMQPPGLAAIEKAKENGQWEAAYDSFRTSTIPEDLQEELDKHPKSAEFFATLNSQNRYAILFRIQTAKKPETRRKRIDQFIAMLERQEKIYP